MRPIKADYKRSSGVANQASLETPEVNVPSPQEVEFQGPDENLEEVDMDLEDDLVFGRDEWGFVDNSKENLQPTQVSKSSFISEVFDTIVSVSKIRYF